MSYFGIFPTYYSFAESIVGCNFHKLASQAYIHSTITLIMVCSVEILIIIYYAIQWRRQVVAKGANAPPFLDSAQVSVSDYLAEPPLFF